jgi:hypothetical protein
MKLLYEYEQLIHVDKNTELKQYQIKYALYDAQKTRRYAKFYTGRYYISVAFNRDYTIQLSSNYRVDMRFNKELQRLENKKFSLNTTSYFIWYWMNKLRKL